MDSKDLNNIASVYEAVYGGGKKEEKKDTRLVVTAADKKANTKAYQNYKAGNKAYKAADHLKEGKKKVKRWWDDDGDGIGYEKGEVKKEQNELGEAKKKPSVHDDYYDPMEDPEFDPHEAEATRGQSGRGTSGKMNVRKKYSVKEGQVKKEIEDLRKAAKTGKGKYVAKADKLEEKKKDTPDQVAAVIDMYRSKKGTGEAVKDTEEGKTEAAKKERDYAAWERSKMKKDDPDWKHKKGSTTESVDVDYIDTVQKIKAAETEADIKRWKALEESGNFTDEEIQTIKEADIADILARLEKKRISKGGDPEESPLPAMKKYHAKKKKVKEEVESIEEADSLSGQVARWEAARQKRMKQRQSYERPSWIPRDQDHEDNWGSSKGEKKKG